MGEGEGDADSEADGEAEAEAVTEPEAEALLRDIASVDFSERCPHGRTVVKSFSRSDMDAIFGRS